ncbi:MAG: LysR family transcriptional regulator [Lentisphaerae bacterium]|nr:LysR family transcriptional regulator [Lentisphaerota bacterium]
MATIRQIEIFLQLARTLHFARAAEKLHITQAALSRELLKLEEDLQCRLLDRSDKWNIKLTAAGRTYFEQVCDLPQKLELAGKNAQRAHRGEIGMISIAVASMVYEHLHLEEFFRKMHEKYPDVKLFIRDIQGSPVICEQLLSGEADIGFMAVSNYGTPKLDLCQQQLMELDVSLAIPADHPLAVKKDLELKDLVNCNFIMPPRNRAPWLRGYLEKVFFDKFHTYPRVEQEALGIQATRQLVSAGLGIGLVVKPMANDDPRCVVYRKMPLDFKRIIVAAWDQNNQSQVLKNMLKLLPDLPRKNGTDKSA